MPKGRRYTPEQIITKLREAEVLQSQANDVVGEKGQVDTELAERDIVEKDVVGNELTGSSLDECPYLIY